MGKKQKDIPRLGYDAMSYEYNKIYGGNKSYYRVLERLHRILPSNSKILDVGSGTGIPVAKFLTEKGHEVTGIDNSTQMIKIARKNVPKARFIEMNMKRLRLSETYNAITAFFSLLHIPKAIFPRTLTLLAKHLETGGYFVIAMIEGNADIEQEFIGQRLHFTAYPREELETLLQNHGFIPMYFEENLFKPKMKGAEKELQLFYLCKKQE